MEKLWAPWRSRFINLKVKKGCIFCSSPKEKKDQKNYILERSRFSFAMLNIYPYNNGHLMISPFRHLVSLEEFNDEEILDLMNLTKKWKKILREVFNPQGFNLGINLGKVSGAGFKHLHLHIVPRWAGDSNFMPLIANTKVLNESLNICYKKLIKKNKCLI